MNEKVKVKFESEQKIEESNSNFFQYLKDDNLEEWGKKYLSFLSEEDVKAMLEYYKKTYNILV